MVVRVREAEALPEIEEFSITIGLPVNEWRDLLGQMSETEWPASQIRRQIEVALIAVDLRFAPGAGS